MKDKRLAVLLLVVCASVVSWLLRRPIVGTAAQAAPATKFHGVVKDLRGAPLPALLEATWIAADAEPVVAGSTTADERGAYRLLLELPAARDGVLVLAASAHGLERAGRRAELTAARQDFVLAPAPARVTLLVKDELGKAVSDAQVTLSIEPGAGERNGLLVLTGRTGFAGEKAFEGIPGPAATLHWSVRAVGHAPAFGDRSKAWGSAPSVIEVTLPRGVTVRGLVAEADGRPVSGADVLLAQQTGPWSAKARTDALGAFSISDVPRGGPMSAQLEADGHVLSGGREEAAFSIPLDAEGHDLRLEAEPGGRIAGVVEGAAGGPIAGAAVDAVALDGRMSRRKAAESDRDGRFRIAGLRLDTQWRLEARHAEHAPAFLESVRASRSGGDLRIRLSAGGSIAGLVLGDDGAPLPGVEAYAQRIERAEHLVTGLRELATARAAADGTFKLSHLNPGSYRVELRPPARMAWSPIAASVLEAEVREGQTTRLDAVTLLRPGSLRAWVTSASAADPGEGFVLLSFMQAGARGAPQKVTLQRGAGGALLVEGLEPGRYDLSARIERSGVSSLANVAIEPGRVTEVSFDFEDRPSLSGVVERADRTPAAAAKVDVFAAAAGSQRGYALPGRAPDNFTGNHSAADANGRYRVHGLEVGEYIVRVTTSGEAPLERRVQVGAAGAVADFILAPPAMAEVSVTGADGRPLASKIVVLESRPGNPTAGYSESAVTNDRGVVVFRALPAGEHLARVVAGAQPRQSFTATPGETASVAVQVMNASTAR